MTIRTACLSYSHIPQVLQVQQELAIGADMIAQGETVAPKGLLVSGHNHDDLVRYLDEGGQLYGAWDGRELIGYALTAPGPSFAKKYVKAEVSWTDSENEQSFDAQIRGGDFLYLDQIGVKWDHHGTGVSKALLTYVERACNKKSIIVLIVTEPIDNVKSRKFFESTGYQKICDITFKRFGTIDNFTGVLVSKKVSE